MSKRAELRRQKRQKDWVGFEKDPDIDVAAKVEIHMMQCKRCQTGNVSTKGCPWLRNFMVKNPDVLRSFLGMDSASKGTEELEEPTTGDTE